MYVAGEYGVYIRYAYTGVSLALFSSEKLSDFVVNGAGATRHPSRDVSSQAFPDFKNADLRATGKAWEPRLLFVYPTTHARYAGWGYNPCIDC